MGKYSEFVGGSRSVMTPTVAVLVGLALFGSFSNQNKFIIGVTGYLLFFPYDYKHTYSYDSKLVAMQCSYNNCYYINWYWLLQYKW
ncbi:hypothetical protein [Candidatus Mesenet endosymbiont of Phosphuga atrata]|uniref:hypothetical protein n=1 Tax=Candidatus Mesenet endosymbiont of Phosphuga atrata TaxID=3066221 RepID=UPI0030CC4465